MWDSSFVLNGYVWHHYAYDTANVGYGNWGLTTSGSFECNIEKVTVHTIVSWRRLIAFWTLFDFQGRQRSNSFEITRTVETYIPSTNNVIVLIQTIVRSGNSVRYPYFSYCNPGTSTSGADTHTHTTVPQRPAGRYELFQWTGNGWTLPR